MNRGIATPWDRCEVQFFITNPHVVTGLGLCDELPVGWVVVDVAADLRRRGYTLTFEVQGEATDSDGWVVRRILQHLGAL